MRSTTSISSSRHGTGAMRHGTALARTPKYEAEVYVIDLGAKRALSSFQKFFLMRVTRSTPMNNNHPKKSGTIKNKNSTLS